MMGYDEMYGIISDDSEDDEDNEEVSQSGGKRDSTSNG